MALKGIIGIEAMAVISNETDHSANGANYTAIAHNYIDRWQILGIAHNANPPHATLAYGSNNSHGMFSLNPYQKLYANSLAGLLYNLYADRELGLNLVPQSVYDMQSTFYPTVQLEYGVPLDTRHEYTKGELDKPTVVIYSLIYSAQPIGKCLLRPLHQPVLETCSCSFYQSGSTTHPQTTQ